MSNLSDPSFGDPSNHLALKRLSVDADSQSSHQENLGKTKESDSSSDSANAITLNATNTQQAISEFFIRAASSPSHNINITINQVSSSHGDDSNADGDLNLDEFVDWFNKIYNPGSHKVDKATDIINKMRALGGLDGHHKDKHLDLTFARKALAILTGLSNRPLKLKALQSLQELLYKDPLTVDSFEGLVELMETILTKINRAEIQRQSLQTQIEFAKVYGAVAQLLLLHYNEKNSNGITKELKDLLSTAASELKYLNRQNDPNLSYHAKFALEGIIRLQDDELKLITLMQRCYHLSLAGYSAYCEAPELLATELSEVFKDLKLYPKHSWYDMTFLLRHMSSVAKNSESGVIQLLSFININENVSWNFNYEVTNILSDIAINGQTPEIRDMALSGWTNVGKHLDGLIDYAYFKEYHRRVDLINALLYLKPPTKVKNTNTFIRTACLKKLMQIAYEAPDKTVRCKARKQILAVYDNLPKEKSSSVKKLMEQFIKYDKSLPYAEKDRKKWVQEKGIFAQKPKTYEEIDASAELGVSKLSPLVSVTESESESSSSSPPKKSVLAKQTDTRVLAAAENAISKSAFQNLEPLTLDLLQNAATLKLLDKASLLL